MSLEAADKAARGARHDTPYVTCGECLGDGRILAGVQPTNPQGKVITPRFMDCHDCHESGKVPNEQAEITNEVDAWLSVFGLTREAIDQAERVEWCDKHDSPIDGDACKTMLLVAYRTGGNPYNRISCKRGWRLLVRISDVQE